jgi:hypothetical protein
MPVVLCATTHCGKPLGEVDLSVLAGRPRPVWRIRPGWSWHKGILEYRDETYRSERGLAYEMTGHEFAPAGGRLTPAGLELVREADLPLCVRCPHCHRPRWISVDLHTRSDRDAPARPSLIS